MVHVLKRCLMNWWMSQEKQFMREGPCGVLESLALRWILAVTSLAVSRAQPDAGRSLNPQKRDLFPLIIVVWCLMPSVTYCFGIFMILPPWGLGIGLHVGWLSSLILKGLVPLNGQSRRIREGISSLPTPGSSTSGPNLQGPRAMPLVCGYLCCV